MLFAELSFFNRLQPNKAPSHEITQASNGPRGPRGAYRFDPRVNASCCEGE
jgi:hypothetical protein